MDEQQNQEKQYILSQSQRELVLRHIFASTTPFSFGEINNLVIMLSQLPNYDHPVDSSQS